MSSSAEPFGWTAFRERELPAELDLELLSPAAEVAALLQRNRRDLDARRADTERAVAAGRTVSAEHAALVFRLGAVLDEVAEELSSGVHKRLKIVWQQMVDALAKAGLEVVDPLGRPFDEIEHQVDVVGWRHDARFTGELVAETIEPIILHDTELVRAGRVIMGAPGDCSEEEEGA